MKVGAFAMSVSYMTSEVSSVNLQDRGIFDQMFKEDFEMAAVQKEHDEAVARKKQQLAQAEIEHEKLVAEEEAEERSKAEKAAIEAEKKVEEDKRREAEQRKQELFNAIDRGEAIQLGSQMGDSPSVGAYDREGITFLKNVKQTTEYNSPADIIGSAPRLAQYVQLNDDEEEEPKKGGMPGMGIGGPSAGKKATKKSSENSTADATANSTSNATADSNSTSDANSTESANATGNATSALNKTKAEYNSPADVMPYASANDVVDEKPIDWKMERKDKVTPYLARPAKYRVNYPEENHHHKYAPKAPESK